MCLGGLGRKDFVLDVFIGLRLRGFTGVHNIMPHMPSAVQCVCLEELGKRGREGEMEKG